MPTRPKSRRFLCPGAMPAMVRELRHVIEEAPEGSASRALLAEALKVTQSTAWRRSIVAGLVARARDRTHSEYLRGRITTILQHLGVPLSTRLRIK